MRAGENIRINIRVQDASSGEILSTEKVEGVGESAIFSMVDDLTRRLKRRLEVPEVARAELNLALMDVTTSSPEAYRYYIEARKHQLAGEYGEAIALYEKAVELDPRFSMALAGLDVSHDQLGHRKEALEYRRMAVESADRLPARERYYVVGNFYRDSWATVDRAIEAYEKAIEFYPDNNRARNNLGNRYLALERPDEAIVYLEENRRRKHTSANSYGLLAECYAMRGQFEGGYRVLQDCLGLLPGNPDCYGLLGVHLARWGKLDEAIQALDKAESLDPSYRYLPEYRWGVYVLRESWPAAEAASQKLLASSEPYHQWQGSLRLAVTNLYHGRVREGSGFFQKAILADSEAKLESAVARNLYAHALITEGDLDSALEEAQKAQAEGRGHLYFADLDGLFFAAVAQIRLGLEGEAERTAEELRLKARSIPGPIGERTYHHLLGEMALARGDLETGVAELERAGSMLATRGFAGVWEHRPQHVPIWFSLSRAYLEAGQAEQAAPWFQRIIDSTTERVWWPIPYVRSFYFLGKIQENQGDMEKARENYRRFYEYWKEGDIDRERVEEARQKLEPT